MEKINDDTGVHSAKSSGGFIIFGGWIKVYDDFYNKGEFGHELYLSFGGIGVGAFNSSMTQIWPEEGITWDQIHNTVKKFSGTLCVNATLKLKDGNGTQLAHITIPDCFNFGACSGSVKVES